MAALGDSHQEDSEQSGSEQLIWNQETNAQTPAVAVNKSLTFNYLLFLSFLSKNGDNNSSFTRSLEDFIS